MRPLPGAITKANNSPENDSIEFDATVFSNLQSILIPGLTIANNGSLTINGSGKVIVSANNQAGGVEVNSGAAVTFNDLQIIGSNGGGGVGGIKNNSGGTVFLVNSTVTGNSALFGGGISNNGTFNVINSTISGNSATNGGGVDNRGTLNVINSTLANNFASGGNNFGGRVLTSSGQGLTNARVILTEQNGTARSALTGAFGYYRFDDVASGRTYVITILSKRFSFDGQVVSVMENIEELNFTAAP